jgi:predicted metal-binding membrane protein
LVLVSASLSRLGFSSDGRAKAPVAWAALLAGAALGWTVTIRGAMEMGNGTGTMGRGLAGFMLLWIVMMAAMMLPSVAPVGSLYLRSLRSRSTGALRVLRVGSMILGYLGAWTAFGTVAYALAWAGGRLAAEAPSAAPWVGAVALLIAVGVMNLAWMAGLAAVIFLEKTWRYGKALGIAFGIALLVVALFVPSHPELVPGLHGDGGTGTMRMER